MTKPQWNVVRVGLWMGLLSACSPLTWPRYFMAAAFTIALLVTNDMETHG